MKNHLIVFCMLLICAGAVARDGDSRRPALSDVAIKYRWVYKPTNLATDEGLQGTIDMVQRIKRAGYNGIFINDSKMDKFQFQTQSYAVSAAKLRKACTDEGVQLIVNVCPMGYAGGWMAADPNLAEGMPVRNAAMQVKQGTLVPYDDTTTLVNGSLSQWKGDTPVGWTVDRPGSVSFRDDQVQYNGKPTLRQDHSAAAKSGKARLSQTIKVLPWHYYHISVMAKSKDCTSRDLRIFAVSGDANKGFPLNWQPPAIKKTMDWTRLHATFCSGDSTQVGLYIGAYSPKGGKIWWSDVQIEPGGFVNLIRRASLPLSIRSEDGKKLYVEGRDFAEIVDPKLGHDPNPGHFTYWHSPPTVAIPHGSRLREGQKVLASYHFATTVGKAPQINCCLSEPKVYELIDKQVQWVEQVIHPDIFMLGHDEIRHCGWDDTCTKSNMTCGQILAENIRKCAASVQKAAPGRPVVTWSDMFDPFHNARKTGQFYLAKGDGPYNDSWEGLPASVIMLNWNGGNLDSLRFFAGHGNRQVLAGFYDGDPKQIVPWLKMASEVQGVCGVMYTTWTGDYSKLDDFMENVRQFEADRAKGK